VVHGVADILLEELERSRDDHMRDIVATIQADQYRLITREPGGVLVIQGGPGTGKTAVGLHRASWLLYTHRAELERNGVLVVGPNPIFMDYIAHVLPMLGEDRVEQRAIDQLAGFTATRTDPPEVARVKSDTRMADLLAIAAHALPSSVDERVGIRIDGAYLYLEPDQVAELIGEANESARSYADSRERFRSLFVRRLYEQYARKLDDLAFRSFDELEKAIRTFTNGVLDKAFPKVKPEQLVRRVLADEGLPATRGWSDADLPLLDEARALLEGPSTRHGHLIVDEAQDLTPMQLRMLARRSTGPMTIIGDIAQASGVVSYHRWEEVLEHLATDAQVDIAELRLAYRVPREVMELALPLLPLIAPDVAPPIAYRDGDEPPRFVATTPGELVATAVEEATREALREGRTALIAPASLLTRIEPALGSVLDAGTSAFDDVASTVRTLTPRAAKGLEFDRVVLVEPATIVDELGGVDGLRALYVALTRSTKTLVIVHAKPLPEPLR
jgi:DNA helicase IV